MTTFRNITIGHCYVEVLTESKQIEINKQRGTPIEVPSESFREVLLSRFLFKTHSSRFNLETCSMELTSDNDQRYRQGPEKMSALKCHALTQIVS